MPLIGGLAGARIVAPGIDAGCVGAAPGREALRAHDDVQWERRHES